MNGSIQDIVFHVAGDKRVQLSAAFEGGSVTWDEYIAEHPKGSVDEMLAELKASHTLMMARMEETRDEALQTTVSTWGGKKMAIRDLFVMLIEHDIYHAGQIRYVRNLLGR
jgi:uncharacterized damage-inducible protein DinB